MEKFWYMSCPYCNQNGRLFIMRNKTTGKLYLHCDEGECGYPHPDSIFTESAWFLTLTEDFESDFPSREEIEAAGWGEYCLHVLVD